LYGRIAVSASEPPFTFDEFAAGIRQFFQYLHLKQLDMKAEPADDDTIVLYGRRSNLIFPQQRGDSCCGFLCLRASMHVIVSARLGTWVLSEQ